MYIKNNEYDDNKGHVNKTIYLSKYDPQSQKI